MYAIIGRDPNTHKVNNWAKYGDDGTPILFNSYDSAASALSHYPDDWYIVVATNDDRNLTRFIEYGLGIAKLPGNVITTL